jgi:hypothetical protein
MLNCGGGALAMQGAGCGNHGAYTFKVWRQSGDDRTDMMWSASCGGCQVGRPLATKGTLQPFFPFGKFIRVNEK